MPLLIVFVILAIGLFGFLTLMWTTRDLSNTCIKFLLGCMCVYGIYLLVNVIPNIAVQLGI